MIDNVFIELSIIIGIVIIIATLMRILRQPLIIGYIITGIIVGPNFLNIMVSKNAITTFSQIGITLLLFMVGLNLDLKIIKGVGKVALITGIGQVLFTSLIGYFICYLLGFSKLTSFYIAIALTFSSTIIIMKLLSDKGNLETLYGRISIGFLIVQDLIVIIILMIISAIPAGNNLMDLFLGTFFKGIGILGILFLASMYIIPKIVKLIAKSQEFLLLFSIGWCLALASLVYYMKFSMEIGALLAGITLAASPYRYEIGSKMKPLRDFFIVLFFILLGSQMFFSDISSLAVPAVILSIFILVGNPLIVMVLMGYLGYTKRNSFLAGLTVAQISEFSLILIMLGVKVGHLTNEILSFVTIIGLATIAGSTYMILYADKIYPYLAKYLSVFEKKGVKIDEHKYHKNDLYDIFLFGCNRIGNELIKSFKKSGKKFLVIDYNPETIIELAKKRVECRYGDAEDFELLNELNLAKAKMVISTIPNPEINLLLIKKTKEANPNSVVIVTSMNVDDALDLYNAGADYVILPHFLGGERMSILLEESGKDIKKLLEHKISHIKELKKRKKLGHKHPKKHRHR
jgi:Kef-type K+ transport system membrane component KefB/Trk K+ transport system NAD-binding subunit